MKFKLFPVFILACLVIGLVGPGSAFAQSEPLSKQETKTAIIECPPSNLESFQYQDQLHSLPTECKKEYRQALYHTGKQTETLNVTPTVSGGPDDFGYIFDDSVTYNWISATTNSGLIGDDESAGPFNLGFNFPFFEQTYNQFHLGTNGLITFDPDDDFSYSYGGDPIPYTISPNNFIAPFWEDLVVGSPDNSGGIYTMQGGTAPNRYYVMEWRDVTTYAGSSPFSFEAILYENGDVVFQHQSLPEYYYSTVGIENNRGDDGLQYQVGGWGLSAPKAIRFYRPADTARLALTPREDGSFTQAGGTASFSLTLINTGGLGADTYDLTAVSTWPATLYAADGTTLLIDTDDDTLIDTGPISQGGSVEIIAKIAVPANAPVGAHNTAAITATSSLNISKAKIANLTLAVPVSFANIFENDDDGAMNFMIARPFGTSTIKASPDNHYGSNIAVERLVNGNYLYIWDEFYYQPNDWDYDLGVSIVSPRGDIIRPAGKLTNSSGDFISTHNLFPSIATTPNGTIGLIWTKRVYNSSDQFNENIFLGILDSSGYWLSDPINLTNNTTWGNYGEPDFPRFNSPTIAATDDNRFVLSWGEIREFASGDPEYKIWYATRSADGASIFGPSVLTNNLSVYRPVLNSLTGAKAILAWSEQTNLIYAVINSDGSIFKASEAFAPHDEGGHDAIQLPNGKVAIAWITDTNSIKYAILNASTYMLESGPFTLNTGTQTQTLSLTTDADNHIIMTWASLGAANKLYYAAADHSGTILTPPMIFETSASYIETGWNGQGSAPYTILDITGNTGAGDVVLNYMDGSAKTVTSDSNGNYTLSVPLGWSGVVTPSKAGYGFVPASKTYTNLAINLTDENYEAVLSPEAFAKTSPANTINEQPLSPTLSWEASNNATSYEYCYSSAPGPCVKWNSVGTATSVTLSGLAPNYTYYWQVRAVNAGSITEADGGTWWSFTTTTAPICTWPAYTPPVSATFNDVPMTVGHWSWVERLANSTVTAGCGNGNFCPLTEVNRAQMAIFLLRSKHCGNTYTPPAVGDTTGFGDVPLTASYAAWVKQLAAEGITAGCGNGNFCPQTIVNRAQMAIFLLRAKHGATYSPPAVGASTGFGDVSLEASFAPWVKQLAAEGVTSGCGNGNFCPLTNVNRAQMATFLVRAFGLP